MDLLTTQHAAKELKLSARTLERHRVTGTGPKFIRLGRRIFYRRDDLEAWIAACTCRSTSEADEKCKKGSQMPSHGGVAEDMRGKLELVEGEQ